MFCKFSMILTGVDCEVLVPFPRRPPSLLPQAQTLPSDLRKRLCLAPAEISVTPLMT